MMLATIICSPTGLFLFCRCCLLANRTRVCATTFSCQWENQEVHNISSIRWSFVVGNSFTQQQVSNAQVTCCFIAGGVQVVGTCVAVLSAAIEFGCG